MSGARVIALADEVTATLRVNLARAERLAATLESLVSTVDDAVAQGRAWRAIGHVAALRGRYARAVRYYERALAAFSDAGNALEGAITRSGALQTLIYLARYRDAFRWASLARRVFRRRGDTLRLARLETNVGNVLHRNDRFDEALERYAIALEVFEAGGHRADEAVVLRNMAVCYIGLNQFGPAMATYERARACALAQQLAGLVAEVDYNIAYLHYLRGDYRLALRLYAEARTRCLAADDRYHAALCDLDQAELALELNLLVEGDRLAAAAYDGFRQLGLTYERAKARANQGIAAHRREQLAEAVTYYREARALFRREKNVVWTALLDVYLALVLLDQGRVREATRLARVAVRQFARLPFEDRRALALFVLARTVLAGGRSSEARTLCRRALTCLTHHPVPALSYRVWHLLGQLESRAGRQREAMHAFGQAHLQVESLRGHLSSDTMKVAFQLDKTGVYESLVAATLLGRSPKLEQAFRFTEQAKARTLVEQISGLMEPASAEPAGDDTQALEAAYRHRDARPAAAASAGTSPGGQAAVGTGKAPLARMARRLQRLARRASARGTPTVPRDPTVSLTTLQAGLALGTTLVEYYVVEGQLLVWVITRGEASVHRLGPEADAFRALRFLQFQIARCRWHLHQRAPDAAPAIGHLGRLYDLLLRPVEPYLQQADHLVVVPHGTLHAVPFAALHDGIGYLCDRITVSVAPSASVYAMTMSRPAARRRPALVVGVPDPHAPLIAREVEEVVGAFRQPRVLAGAAATREAFATAASRARVLHLATHGHFRSDNPDFSSIQLVDGPVTLKDLEGMALDADLVVLSGCGTGRLVVAGGDELFGLSRGLLRAGARSLLVALWDVSDVSAVSYMRGFYTSLRKGLSRGEAARAGARAVRAAHPHPFFWAPFVLVGDHRRFFSPGIFFIPNTHPSGVKGQTTPP